MTVTDEMIEAASKVLHKAGYIIHHQPVIDRALKAALSTIKPMTENEIDDMIRNNDHDSTYDLVESVEYWHGIRGQ